MGRRDGPEIDWPKLGSHVPLPASRVPRSRDPSQQRVSSVKRRLSNYTRNSPFYLSGRLPSPRYRDCAMDGDLNAAAHAGPSSRPGGAGSAMTDARPKVQQPKPQALPSRAGPSSILVSPRQKGNPVLNNIRSVPWEYSDIPADYVVGATTCALFLSLKYHRLHPEYIYTRIKNLQGKYGLRLVLAMVDIQNHEESIKELTKTSIINNVTIILCWSAQEAGHYLEMYKTYEFAQPTSIKAHQSTTYSDRLVDFITVPKGINKTDAVGLVSNFGSIRTAVNARPEEVALIAGWGEKKVQRWCSTVREPLRLKKAAQRGIAREDSRLALSRDISMAEGEGEADSRESSRPVSKHGIGRPITPNEPLSRPTSAAADADQRQPTGPAEELAEGGPGDDEKEALREFEAPKKAATAASSNAAPLPRQRPVEDQPSEGVMAALAKLRQQG